MIISCLMYVWNNGLRKAIGNLFLNGFKLKNGFVYNRSTTLLGLKRFKMTRGRIKKNFQGRNF
jgi:hypothetical protein